ncbi:MAG: DUF4199 domain-containing protein [Cytophagales bacterium]|nr:DUF4199 domain-containing protein [Cytophagales bacterium]
MEEATQPSTRSIGIKYGLISGLVGIVLFVVYDLAGIPNDSKIRWISFLPGIVILILAHKAFKDEGNGYMSFGQGMGIGTAAAFFGSLLSAAIMYVYVAVVSTDYFERMAEQNLRTWEEAGMSDAEISAAEQFSGFMMNPAAFTVMALIGGFIGGIIMALIISAFTKKQDPAEII